VPQLIYSLIAFLKTDSSIGLKTKDFDILNGWMVMPVLDAKCKFSCESVLSYEAKKKDLNRIAIDIVEHSLLRKGKNRTSVARRLDFWPLISCERLAPYLIRRCASGHRSGRRWKTRLRLGNWRDFSTESAESCPCCHSNVNDLAHALFSYSAFGVNECYNSVSQ